MTKFFSMLIGTVVGIFIGLFVLGFVYTAVSVSTFRHDCTSLNGVSVKSNPGWVCVSKSALINVPE